VSIHFILMMKVKPCIRKGCWLYVVELVSEEKGPSLDKSLVLLECRDFFPKELDRVTS
jgi:hypothetical protein